VPVILDRADKLITDADELSKKAGEQAGRGVFKGAIKGVIGLPMDTTRSIIRVPVGKGADVEETKEKK
jgi:hypothetical protein